MNILAQQEMSGGFASVLERAPTEEIMVMGVVFIVFATLLLITITFCVTGTIRSIKIASINARLTEKLVREGVPHGQVERLVRANGRRISFPAVCFPSRWQKAQTPVPQIPGKPAPLRS